VEVRCAVLREHRAVLDRLDVHRYPRRGELALHGLREPALCRVVGVDEQGEAQPARRIDQLPGEVRADGWYLPHPRGRAWGRRRALADGDPGRRRAGDRRVHGLPQAQVGERGAGTVEVDPDVEGDPPRGQLEAGARPDLVHRLRGDRVDAVQLTG